MSSNNSTKYLSHAGATEALFKFVTRPMIDSIDLESHAKTTADEKALIEWIAKWPPKSSPQDYIKKSSEQFTPSIQAINAVCLSHRFIIHAIRLLALDKGTHSTVVYIQPLLAIETFRLQSKQSHQFETVLKLADCLLNYLALWSASLGVKGGKTLDSLREILTSSDSLELKLEKLENKIAALFNQLEKLRFKLVDMVEGQLSRREGQQQCARVLRETVLDKVISNTCANFLSGPWYDVLQHLYLTEGDRSSIWKKSLNTTNDIVSTFIQSNNEELPESFGPLKASIVEFMAIVQHSDNEDLKWVEDLESEFWGIKKSLEVDYGEELDLPNIDIGDSLDLNISDKLIRNAKRYVEGDWFRFSGNYSGRSQILAISKNGHRYIFNNLNGQKTFDFSIKEFAYLIANGHAKPLEEDEISDDILEKILLSAIEKSASNKKQSAENAIEKSRNKALQEADEIQKRRKSNTLEMPAVETDTSNQGDLEERIRILEIEKSLLQMDLGDWITVNTESPALKLKLAVKLSSSDKYIFTNELGLGRHEYKIDELTASVMRNEITLHNTHQIKK